jgi:uncharacterized repeat protein (TIGR01451 family)
MRTILSWLLPRLLLLLALCTVAPVQAQQTLFKAPYATNMCAADRFGGNLNCTAQDVKITKIIVTPGSGYPAGCVAGSTLTLDLDVTVQFGANSRYDVGIFLSEDGASPQNLSTRSIAGATGSAQCRVVTLPIPPFSNLETGTAADTCGDGNANATATFTIPQVQVKCQALASNFLNIPFVVTWDQSQSPTNSNGGNGQPPVQGICVGPSSPVPGTTAKCSAPSGTQTDIQIIALPTIAKSDGIATMSPGDSTTYKIDIVNGTGFAITNSVFKDPAVANLAVSSVTCAAQNATCPASVTVAGMQGAGLTVPSIGNGGTITFSVTGTLTGGPAENPTSQVTNTASITIAGVSNSASDTNTIVFPSLLNQKVVSTISDPIRGTSANALSIPGAVARYTITVSNTGQGRVDANTAVVTDAVPANTSLYVSMPAGSNNCSAVTAPVSFTDGSPSSTLTFAAANLKYSADNGATWTATPSWVFVPASGTVPAGCYAPNITNLQANPQGRMAAASSFTLSFLVLVK